MISIPQLWLPILLSAVIVFVASSILHMVFTYHHSAYRQMPSEDKLREAMRSAGLTPGLYSIPWSASPKDMGKPEMVEKFKEGPVALMTVIPSGPMNMGKYLVQWFLFCVAVGVMVAYLAGRTLEPGAHYLTVFRVAGTTAFLGYAMAYATNSIWKGQPWSTTLKEMFDGLIYALLTAGTFGWLWPR